ncbi:MAG: ATP-binding protein [Macellibacteroides sp.]|uniref:ATP-binding protein n=1 Tax=Macellibacteroides sp. TaxID=2014584 RepID=UPI003E727D33
MSHNYSLFSTQSSEAGYRLQRVEIFNWGVFDKQIFSISPEGNTSLLTGANGAGKTTYLEAILTLLVPERRMRRYNQASGANTKDERSEESYVLGEIGETEYEQTREIQRLRHDKTKTYSIILAVFRNEERFITLAQTRWFVGSEMKRSFVISHKELSIEKDLIPFDANGLWKKRLKQKYPKYGTKELVEFFDSPGKYAEAMRRFFGMRSEKASILFSQTVGLKVLGNLDDFIRKNMLEETNIEDEFFSLKEGFQSLVKAHNQILKAETQLGLLNPIVEKDKELQLLNQKRRELDELQNTTPIYFTTRKQDLLEKEIEKQERELNDYDLKIKDSTDIIQQKEDDKTTLMVEIKQDEVGNQIAELEKRISTQTKEKERREGLLDKYNNLVRKINLQENPDEKYFDTQLETINSLKQTLEKDAVEVHRSCILEEEKVKRLNNDYAEKASELETLRKQKNNITGRVAEIRQEILQATGATETEIPFIGELLQIRTNAKNKWEFAIEKVLHHFALQLIVPERFYHQVNQFVNDNNLKGRIVYQRIKEENFLNQFVPDVQDSLFSKMELNRQSEYADWLENQIRTHFDYVCTDDLSLFKTYKRALTSSGLIKNDRRHEKDDRLKVFDKSHFVLGWDNKEKIKITQKTLFEIDIEIKTAEKQVKTYERQYDRMNKEKEIAILLSGFEKFQEINWQEMVVSIQKITEEKEALIKTNNRVETLKKQLNELIDELKVLNEHLDTFKSTRTLIDDKRNNNRKELITCKQTLSEFSDMDFAKQFSFFESCFEKSKQFTLSTFESIQKEIRDKLLSDINENNNKIKSSENKLSECLIEFKKPSQELRGKFPDWESDTDKLSLNLEFISDYIELYNRIKNEQLYEYKERFKKYLNNDMIDRMTKFQAHLETQEENIRENIEALNNSLEKINFRPNPETYIFLDIKKDNSEKIRQFRLNLKEWKPNMAEYLITKEDQILEKSFLKIKSLIETLSNNENERRYVTDVRNWLNFSAKELRREDKSIYRTYDSTGKLSGGEKAQLTYTILGSAIAYQFGISQTGRNTNSFRFICIDESFSNQDTEKANYLMQLCKQLHLQLLCVTPDTQTGVIEPYISAVHFVKRESNRNAVIYDLPILQFQTERQKYIAAQS